LILYPAIDILDGRAVRLRQGRFEDETVYRDDPLEAARDWVDAGARYLHVVDLDGARSGQPSALEHLERIARDTKVPVQYGGGLRSLDAVRAAIEAGAQRAVIGTAAFRDVDLIDAALAEFGTRIAIAIDVREGSISTEGWTESMAPPPAFAVQRLQDRGARTFIYTDADRDGMLEGPDLDAVRAFAEAVRGHFIYSGGIGGLEHLRALAGLRQVNMAGVIVGKALYEQRFTVAEALDALRNGG
jgi:phosphoribosylformimino-5-aminoimidazole carboxamide ribotide isomerase